MGSLINLLLCWQNSYTLLILCRSLDQHRVETLAQFIIFLGFFDTPIPQATRMLKKQR